MYARTRLCANNMFHFEFPFYFFIYFSGKYFSSTIMCLAEWWQGLTLATFLGICHFHSFPIESLYLPSTPAWDWAVAVAVAEAVADALGYPLNHHCFHPVFQLSSVIARLSSPSRK